MVNRNNLEGHRERFDNLSQHFPDDAAVRYVGGGDPVIAGAREREILCQYVDPPLAHIIDLGCGIGRLTRALVQSGVRSYLGTDILPEVLEQARQVATGRPEFRFALVDDMRIPEPDGVADLVCAFSVFTHLHDEEMFDYLGECRRVLRPGGIVVASYLDFSLPLHRARFLQFIEEHQRGYDVRKWIEKSTLEFFAAATGFEIMEFRDGGSTITASARWPSLPDGRPAPPTHTHGQSLLVARAV